MKRRNNLSIFPFYDDINDQNKNNWYGFGHVYTYNYKIGHIPPFQFIIEDTNNDFPIGPIDTSSLFVTVHPTSYPIGFQVTDFGSSLTAEKFAGDYIVIKQNGSTEITSVTDWNPLGLPDKLSTIPPGNLYFAFVFNGVAYYSEHFSWTDEDSIDTQLKMSWSHNENFLIPYGHFSYQDFTHEMYIKTTIGKPGFEYEDDIVTREGYKFPLHQVSYLKYRFEFYAPEYVATALRVVRQHDFITIEIEGDTFTVDDMTYNVEWFEQGNLARIEIEFTTDTVVAISGRAIGSSEITDPVPPAPPRPVINGDYNSDFNSDYSNE